jgi:hypothetical protein
MGEQVAKGYLKEDFMETFRRYIPKAEVEATKADLAARVVQTPAENGETMSKSENGTQTLEP